MKQFLKLKQVYKCLENAEVGLAFSVKSIKARKYTLNIATHVSVNGQTNFFWPVVLITYCRWSWFALAPRLRWRLRLFEILIIINCLSWLLHNNNSMLPWCPQHNCTTATNSILLLLQGHKQSLQHMSECTHVPRRTPKSTDVQCHFYFNVNSCLPLPVPNRPIILWHQTRPPIDQTCQNQIWSLDQGLLDAEDHH